MKNILIISDGIPGHVNQSKGVAYLLSQSYTVNIELHEMKFKIHSLRSFFTIIAKLLLKKPSKLSATIISFFYSHIDLNGCDLIIASGGKTSPYSVASSILGNKPLIQLGSPRGMNSKLFSALVTVERYFDDPSNVVASLVPNLYSPERCAKSALQRGFKEHILFLIGGKGIGYSYQTHEWDSLISSIQDMYSLVKIPITIVTSRRSDPVIEKKLRTELSNIPLNYSAWFHLGDKDFNLDALLGSAKNIFVTEDSAMMISESISSGKPVSTLYPSNIKAPIRHQDHIKKYLDLEFISRQPIVEFSIKEKTNTTVNVQEHLTKLKDVLIRRIKW
ncbi:mitochondrial fission ELM1 family protein [bacterium]|jgi:mitochondrial fission protein ELM1|nr:mitochondrial fission ELM1 family protein [bacterium]